MNGWEVSLVLVQEERLSMGVGTDAQSLQQVVGLGLGVGPTQEPTLNRPLSLPHVDEDGDAEMEIDEQENLVLIMEQLKPSAANSSPLTPLGFLDRAATVHATSLPLFITTSPSRGPRRAADEHILSEKRPRERSEYRKREE
ncbi:hypothetical protein D0Y65_026157 [Glycine soja]|nr:hypothetical protein D0Y65_026157 [Glycine soja]